ncbi:hypothetical protein HPP92_002115 [Vanilla planifolia]|uniref:Uncharacterized protein n=1 Tax=Vanilla planifolia TaxID=51239 RepID=A0A835VM71_VANPL|nr:hypothetical protein HPP92_002115 [Vanilla planifolia]
MGKHVGKADSGGGILKMSRCEVGSDEGDRRQRKAEGHDSTMKQAAIQIFWGSLLIRVNICGESGGCLQIIAIDWLLKYQMINILAQVDNSTKGMMSDKCCKLGRVGLGYEGCVQTTKEEYNLGAIFSIMWKKSGTWQWNFEGQPIKIYYEEHEEESSSNAKNILMIPTISDVSTVEEWRAVAKDIVTRKGNVSWRATIVDWPGLGYSDRPLLNYNAQVMESFLIELMNAKDSPLSSSAVAPTWCGPLPIVFGRTSEMESRYGLLRGTLRAPAVGWMMYNVLVSNEKSIESQYKSHVYADPNNVTLSIIKSRYALTKRKGSRYVPAAFLTGLLDPVKTREEFLDLFAKLDGVIPILVVSTKNAPKRSKAEIDALVGAKGVTKFVEVAGPFFLKRSIH